MSTTLYPGIAFSPQTVLADNIGAADTIIPVADVSCFPDGPNLATIGTDETGETVFYAAKTADALSGCQRGVEGEARTWMAGEPVGRNFTAKDHNDLIDLLGQKQDKFEGKSGQVVGFNAEGKAVPQEPPVPPNAVTVPGGGEIEMEESLGEGPYTFEYAPEEDGSAVQAAQVGYNSTESGLEAETVQGALDRLSAIKVDVGRVSNPTLLDNGYFADPINQRGQMEYIDFVYTIDRWATEGAIIKVEDDGLQLENPSEGAVQFVTNFEASRLIDNQVYTAAILAKNLVGSGIMIIQHRAGMYTYLAANALSEGLTATSGQISTSGIPLFGITIRLEPHSSVKLIAAKLELGPVQTLAHKEGDTWVLNDPPPNKALELAKCQRYQEKVTSIRTGNSTLGGYVAVGGEHNRLLFAEPIPFKIRKRVMPIIKDVILVPILDDGTATTEMRPTIDWSYCTEDALFQCAVSSQYAIEPGRKYYISFLADANL